ncbi:MAG: penicillin-binding protein 2 [Chitinophagales bacterium]|nr:penicillin-binding protein 2 [Chitinophagales bacterium]
MKGLANRKYSVYYFIILVSLILIARVAYLQLISIKYKEQAQKVTLERQLVYPSRGLIYDRNGKTLVYNQPIYVIYATYRKVNPQMDTTLFCSLLGIDKDIFIKNLNKDWSNPQFHKSIPFVFLSKVSPEQFAIFQEHMYKFPGFTAVERSIRGYPHRHGGHILGYLGEVDQKIIDHSDGAYIPGDYIGKTGLEISYEKELSGSKGINYILRDNLGRRIGPYDNGRLDSMAIPGEDIKISIDLDLQAYADSLMMNKRGALVAIEPATGEILAMVSAPTYDPNLLVLDENRSAGMLQLLRDTINRPLNNRAVTNRFPPGSILKPIISLIALQKGVTWVQRPMSCFGGFRLSATKKMGCHGHAPIHNIEEAIQHSCNTYYLQVTKDFLDQYGSKYPGVGLDTLVSYLHDFGLGRKLGMDFSYEGQGFIPDSKFYDRVYQKEASGWKSMWVLSIGIGQGEVQLTTVQMANLAAIIANRGYYITPHFINQYLSGKPKPEAYTTKNRMRIDAKYFPPVIDGMEAVVTSGTARSAWVPGLTICGKTGTSQNPHGKDHSVFFGFAPKNNSKIAVAVFIENAGWGGDWAAPIASLLMEKHINKSIDPSRKPLEEKMMKGLIYSDLADFIPQKNKVRN